MKANVTEGRGLRASEFFSCLVHVRFLKSGHLGTRKLAVRQTPPAAARNSQRHNHSVALAKLSFHARDSVPSGIPMSNPTGPRGVASAPRILRA